MSRQRVDVFPFVKNDKCHRQICHVSTYVKILSKTTLPDYLIDSYIHSKRTPSNSGEQRNGCKFYSKAVHVQRPSKVGIQSSGFNKYGLWRDDLLYEDQDVAEALKRLDQKTVDERNYRILRATQLSLQKDILPKEQWTKLEEDKLYLTPLVNDVIKEREEREEWNKNH
ncbi:unnamed protein product [Acanthoscelides obtectus]|uniref:Cytochrome b-c1 complex subunit 7 n=1 Tax=Acanthoscelides obtectus TaxID=200917 RepID=A0A9P0Q670_ACAOB|nr:unnamed protein product [Acanthoscelides obtectus]CAK1659573.1 Cytochrome b-c1 complex subunit 7 [Acanthoscelides obtectus]